MQLPLQPLTSLSGNIYWTDQGFDVIEVARLNGSFRYVVISQGLDKPRAITVHPEKGWVWSMFFPPVFFPSYFCLIRIAMHAWLLRADPAMFHFQHWETKDLAKKSQYMIFLFTFLSCSNSYKSCISHTTLPSPSLPSKTSSFCTGLRWVEDPVCIFRQIHKWFCLLFWTYLKAMHSPDVISAAAATAS